MLPPQIHVVSECADDVFAQKFVETTELTRILLPQNLQVVFVCWWDVDHHIVRRVVLAGQGTRPIVGVDEHTKWLEALNVDLVFVRIEIELNNANTKIVA